MLALQPDADKTIRSCQGDAQEGLAFRGSAWKAEYSLVRTQQDLKPSASSFRFSSKPRYNGPYKSYAGSFTLPCKFLSQIAVSDLEPATIFLFETKIIK